MRNEMEVLDRLTGAGADPTADATAEATAGAGVGASAGAGEGTGTLELVDVVEWRPGLLPQSMGEVRTENVASIAHLVPT